MTALNNTKELGQDKGEDQITAVAGQGYFGEGGQRFATADIQIAGMYEIEDQYAYTGEKQEKDNKRGDGQPECKN